MSMPGPKFTYAEYRLLSEDQRYEVIEGELLMTPAPNVRHQRISRRLNHRLTTFVETGGYGEVLYAPTDVILSTENVVQPDLLFVSKERLTILDPDGAVNGAPDLVVEILSPSTASRDRIAKYRLYSKYGVREYWVVDPEARTVEVLVQGSGGLQNWRLFSEGSAVTSPLLPGISVPVAEIFQG